MADVEAHPADYLHGRAKRFNCTPTAVHKAMRRYRISQKKTALKHPKACPVKRDRFRRFQACFRKRNRPLVFLDECGIRKDWIRRYGYAPIGKRCYGEHDWHGKNQVNAIGAVCENRLFAVGLFNHSIDKETFKAWMEQLLIPALPKDSVVVMDNAAFHKSEEISNLLKENGHGILWLPPYSPDLNPIEHKWA